MMRGGPSRFGALMAGGLILSVVLVETACSGGPNASSRVSDEQCAKISAALHYANVAGAGLDNATMHDYGEAMAWVSDGCLEAGKLDEVEQVLAKIKPLGTSVPHPEAPQIVGIHKAD